MVRTVLCLTACYLVAGNSAANDQTSGPESAGADGQLTVVVSWGHRSAARQAFWVRPTVHDCQLASLQLAGAEPGEDSLSDGVGRSWAGGGDVDRLKVDLRFPPRKIEPAGNLHSTWQYLLEHGDVAAAARLRDDPACRRDTRRLTIQLSQDGLCGFSLTVDQLLRHRSFRVPQLDITISAGDAPTDPSADAGVEPAAASIGRDPSLLGPAEASYRQFCQLWEDMGSPSYHNPHAPAPGHIVGLAWDSSLAKFGVDRGGGVFSDAGNPDQLRFWLDIGELTPDLSRSWKGQCLADGLPLVTTTFEKDGVRYDLEQFAYPLHGPPAERRGDMPMVLFQQLTLRELEGRERIVALEMNYHRRLAEGEAQLNLDQQPARWQWSTKSRKVLLAVAGDGWELKEQSCTGWDPAVCKMQFAVPLGARKAATLEVRIPSPPVEPVGAMDFQMLEYDVARQATAEFWTQYLTRGSYFEVPEPEVNTLFRANLWHALRLPRRHPAASDDVSIDLPYSNFAYGQKGTPWPVNQAVYVDYMLYDLRGYHDISAEELAAIFRNCQQSDGRIGGYANWGVYSPGMLYVVAKHYLLSDDRASLERLLPDTLKAADWCLAQMGQADTLPGSTGGLILAPLNDLSHERRAWAFNQAYFFAGFDLLAKALRRVGHPRAAEFRQAAERMRLAIEAGFARATVDSPLVQGSDGTWYPYVPSDASAQGRLLDVWYPTDVDTGALHLSRLKALDPKGRLTTYLLRDHEENLFFRRWGMANEPVYNQQATAYLWRDEPEWCIRAFYSMMACAFSHTVFEPVEHRWGWGQYFGPPSTDGAWFELYRNMLVQERDDDSLLLFAATPRVWLAQNQAIRIERAPTYYGLLDARLESDVDHGVLRARLCLKGEHSPKALSVRFRHPERKPMRAVRVNGQDTLTFDVQQEWVHIAQPNQDTYEIQVQY